MSSNDGADVEEHIFHKYDMKRKLGKGAYGVVWKAVDRGSGDVVAVKKIFDAFRNRTDAQRTFREIMFLQEFGDHVNIVKLLDVVPALNHRDIYLVFEFMDTDLHAVIKRGGLLKDVHHRYIMCQLFRAVKYLHSGNVIHRDQKPSNVLLDSNCVVKLCDFGLARSLNQDHQNQLDLQNHKDQQDPQLTEYVATRWYRAPEILLGSTRYTRGVDMWSLGCILGEMLLGRALFPGSSSSDQVERIMRSVVPPGPDDVASIRSQCGPFVFQSSWFRPQLALEELLPAWTPPDALDLLRKLLVFNPEKRLSAEEALQHPYVARFRDPAKEPARGGRVRLPVRDGVRLSAAQYRQRLYRMIEERRAHKSEPTPSRSGERGGGEQLRPHDQQETKAWHDKTAAARNPGHDSAPCAAGLAAAAHHCSRAAGTVHQDTLPKARRGSSAPQTVLPRSFSSSLSQSLHHHPLLRKDELLPTSGLQNRQREAKVTKEAQEAKETKEIKESQEAKETEDAQLLPRFSKRVFQNNRNVSAAGDPRAKLGSYSQAYGTINKTQLDLLRGNHGKQ